MFNILDRDHPEFKCLFHTCNNYIRKLRTEGVGAETHAAEILTPEEESKLWDNVFLSRCTKKTVECSLLLQWEEFLLCGGAEHRNLKFSQLNRSFQTDGSLHTENISKNRGGGFNQLNVENKVINQYQDL